MWYYSNGDKLEGIWDNGVRSTAWIEYLYLKFNDTFVFSEKKVSYKVGLR